MLSDQCDNTRLFFNNLEEAQQVIQMRKFYLFSGKDDITNLFMGCDCIIIFEVLNVYRKI